ncbi:MAG TPA: hypothetical protein VLR46_13550, partial [Candidatus Dormibacteraeota bacterium]|nr:hypothetical protein [Candidatus Dormibacteraeota bacterium]
AQQGLAEFVQIRSQLCHFRVRFRVDPSIVPVVTEAARGAFSNHAVHRDLGGRERMIESWSSIPTNSEPSA